MLSCVSFLYNIEIDNPIPANPLVTPIHKDRASDGSEKI